MKRIWIKRAILLSAVVSLSSVAIASGPATPKKGRDPNERICETHSVLGSRLATRRVCATRAEWEERRQRERDMIDRTQTQRCVVDPSTGVCSI